MLYLFLFWSSLIWNSKLPVFVAIKCIDFRRSINNSSLTLQFNIYSRDLLLDNAEQQIKSLEVKFVSANASHQSDKEAWEMNLQNLEETWRSKTSMLSQIMMLLTFFSCVFVQSIDAYQLSIFIGYINNFTVRCEALQAQNEASSGQDIQKELDELKLRYKRLKVPCILLFGAWVNC